MGPTRENVSKQRKRMENTGNKPSNDTERRYKGIRHQKHGELANSLLINKLTQNIKMELIYFHTFPN